MEAKEHIHQIVKKIKYLTRQRRPSRKDIETTVSLLRLDDPEGPLCAEAGTDETGRIRCSICRLSRGELAGCMTLIEPIMQAIAQRNAPRARVRLEALAQELADQYDLADTTVHDSKR